VVLKAQLTCQTTELLHPCQWPVPAIQVSPHSPTGSDPIGEHPIREKALIRRWTEVGNHVTVYQSIQIRADHHNPPGRHEGRYGAVIPSPI
jgi:hypothetical protein